MLTSRSTQPSSRYQIWITCMQPLPHPPVLRLTRLPRHPRVCWTTTLPDRRWSLRLQSSQTTQNKVRAQRQGNCQTDKTKGSRLRQNRQQNVGESQNVLRSVNTLHRLPIKLPPRLLWMMEMGCSFPWPQ